MEELIVRYLKGQLNASEQAALEQWLALSDRNKRLFEQITKEEWLWSELGRVDNYDAERGWALVKAEIGQTEGESTQLQEEKPDQTMRRWWMAAAALLLLAGIGVYFGVVRRTNMVQAPIGSIKDVQAPAANRAMVTLANGRHVYLDSAANGSLAMQGNVQIIKLADGKIAYQGAGNEMVYNTLTNPRGSRVVDITLSDGTKVWLNAASSIRYPAAFGGNERKVTVDGEAYFEIAKDARRPFYVSKGDVTVQVLGTHFDVKAYEEEKTLRVTLLEGSVNVRAKEKSVLLSPREQAQVNGKEGNEIRISKAVDLEAVMAWKNGLFAFDRADIETLMGEIGRWYDMEISYEGEKPEMEFGGELERNLNLSQVLRALEKSKVHFRVESHKIIVLK